MEHRLEDGVLLAFEQHLIGEEKSKNTIAKYLRDVQFFLNEVKERETITKEAVIAYKQRLVESYAISSVNSMLASLNHFLRSLGWLDCVVRMLTIQREAFRSHEKELSKDEYLRLLEAARDKGNERLALLMETLGATGIRIGELPFITVEAAKNGSVFVTLKRKNRQVILPERLRGKLLQYAKSHGIEAGPVFITRMGNVMDRSNILREMKALCESAGVERRKIFPHNFRHLFACVFYQMHKDLSRLADLLGHSNVNTTRIYTCISVAEHVKQIEQMGMVV